MTCEPSGIATFRPTASMKLPRTMTFTPVAREPSGWTTVVFRMAYVAGAGTAVNCALAAAAGSRNAAAASRDPRARARLSVMVALFGVGRKLSATRDYLWDTGVVSTRLRLPHLECGGGPA